MTTTSEVGDPAVRTREGRAASTQAHLLDATISCLVEFGFSGASTPVIAKRAGVSRGAQTHHFPTRTALVTAAVEHLADRRAAEIQRFAAELPDDADRVPAALDMLWASFGDELYQAMLELWIASRTDTELRAHVAATERRIGRQVAALVAELLGPEISEHPEFPARVQFALAELRGMAILDTFDPDRSHRDRQWSFARERLVRLFLSAGEPDA